MKYQIVSSVTKPTSITTALHATPYWSNRRIAAVVGVDAKTVVAARKKMVAAKKIPQFDFLLSSDGKWRPANMGAADRVNPSQETSAFSDQNQSIYLREQEEWYHNFCPEGVISNSTVGAHVTQIMSTVRAMSLSKIE